MQDTQAVILYTHGADLDTNIVANGKMKIENVQEIANRTAKMSEVWNFSYTSGTYMGYL